MSTRRATWNLVGTKLQERCVALLPSSQIRNNERELGELSNYIT